MNDENTNQWLNTVSEESTPWSDMNETGSVPSTGSEDVSEAINDQSSLQKATIMLLVACVLGVSAVYLLKMRVKPRVATEQEKALEAQVDLALQKLTDKTQQKANQDLVNDTSEMIQIFYDYPANQQVALQELQRDPFARQTSGSDVKMDEAKQTEDRDKLRKDLEKKLSSLQLQSAVPRATGSFCMINGQFYKEGQIVDETFKIKTISDRLVILNASGMEFQLGM